MRGTLRQQQGRNAYAHNSRLLCASDNSGWPRRGLATVTLLCISSIAVRPRHPQENMGPFPVFYIIEIELVLNLEYLSLHNCLPGLQEKQ